MLTKALASDGARITANSGKEGWEVFKESKPDACVVDLIMEEHDSGFVLAHKRSCDEDTAEAAPENEP